MISDKMPADWHGWAMGDDSNIVYFSEFDMVAGSFHLLEGINVNAYMYHLFKQFGFILPEEVPRRIQVEVANWPKVSFCY
jgi:hypothetical protein